MAPIYTGNKSNVGKIAVIVISGNSWKLTLAPVFDLCLHDDALPLRHAGTELQTLHNLVCVRWKSEGTE